MSGILERLNQEYHYVKDSDADIRLNNLWLMSGPGPIITILAIYLFFCVYAGPKYMKNKKPYILKNVLYAYNLFQIAISAYLVYLTSTYTFTRNNMFQCIKIDYSNTPEGIHEAYCVWVYFIAKFTELLDTVFFVLRKKNNQLTFLHLYHHTFMTALAWGTTKYFAGGQAIIDGGLNSFIHVIMYGYYFLAALGPQFQKYLWWKKYLTAVQLIQFTFIVYLNTNCLLYNDGNYPALINVLVLSNCVFFFYMFSEFFYRNYIKNNKKHIKSK